MESLRSKGEEEDPSYFEEVSVLLEYRRYIEKPTIEAFLLFFESIKEQCPNDYEGFSTECWNILKRAKAHQEGALTLKSNGSTKDPTRYTFAPHAPTVLTVIEMFLRNRAQKPRPCVYMKSMGAPMQPVMMSPGSTNLGMGRFVKIALVYPSDKQIEQLEQELAQVMNEFGAITLVARPEVYLGLSKSSFVKFVEKNPVRLTSCDTPAYYEEAFENPINDQMVEWRTGLNFWTCSYGCRHTLPIFARVDKKTVHLLNIPKQPRPCDDNYQVVLSSCPCGWPLELTGFVSHYRHRTEVALPDPGRLQGRYLNIQLLEDGDPRVYYTPIHESKEDLALLGRLGELRTGGFAVGSNSKQPPTWKGPAKVKEIKLPKSNRLYL